MEGIVAMRKRKSKPSEYDCHKGEGTTAGKSVEPMELPEEETPAEPSPPQAVPIGRPLPPEEYRRLKERARREVAPPAPAAQEDPAVRQDDG